MEVKIKQGGVEYLKQDPKWVAQLIEKLKEYRSSIISHAVTGKIDVREFC